MPKKAKIAKKSNVTGSVKNGIHTLQAECHALVQKLTAAHQDSVKNVEKTLSKAKAEWLKADKAMQKAKAQKAALKAKTSGKKSATRQDQMTKVAASFVKAKALVQTLKKELLAMAPELKAAKAALKKHLALEKAVAKTAAGKKTTAKKATAKTARVSKVKAAAKPKSAVRRGRKVKAAVAAVAESA